MATNPYANQVNAIIGKFDLSLEPIELLKTKARSGQNFDISKAYGCERILVIQERFQTDN